MSLQIRRGTEGQRTGITPDLGEPIWVTGNNKLYIGDGTTAGGVNILAGSAGAGLTWNATTQALDFTGGGGAITTDEISEGTVNKYYTPSRAKDAVAPMFTAKGSAIVTGSVSGTVSPNIITLNSNSGLVALEPFVVTGSGGHGLTAGTYYVVSPTAGTNQITLATTLAGAQDGDSDVLVSTGSITGTNFSAGGPDSNIVFTYDESSQTITANVSLNASGIMAVVDDTTPLLGGNLGLNSHNITGTGNVDITGSITASLGLGGNLPLGGNTINGTGTINYTGDFTNTGNARVNGELTIANANGHGGAGYAGFLTLQNTTATAGKKYVRINSTGELQIINDAYSTTILALSDTGALTTNGAISNGTLTLSGSKITGTVSGNVFDSLTQCVDDVVVVGDATTSNTLFVQGSTRPILVRSLASATGSGIVLQTSRRSGASYTAVQNNDNIGRLIFEAHDGATFKKSSVISSYAVNVSGSTFGTTLELSVLNIDGNYRQFEFTTDGFFSSAGLLVLPLSDAIVSGIPGTEGGLIYNADRKTFQFYDGAGFIKVASAVAVPSTKTSAGKIGQVSGDVNYMYFCYADNNWIRVAKDGTW